VLPALPETSGDLGTDLQILSKDKAVSVYGRDDDLPHPVGLINRVRAYSTALHQLGAEPIDVIDVQIAEQIVGTQIGGRLVARAVPQHHAHAVALDKSPVGGILPTNLKAQYVAKI
jgi:hypothetical protein